jgi:hypothetical protein
LSGPASGLVITSTPAGRFVYWPDHKPADLISGDSRYIAYLESLPFQEGTPLSRAEDYTPTEVASSDSSLGNPDRQVFMAAGDTPGPSGTATDKYLKDISADELSAEPPADETDASRDARRERNRRRNERRRRLQESLPIRNLAEALEQVESKVHTTPEQCLMSITAIARQAQGIRAGEVIAKLAEDAYFMRVDNRVNQPPPARNRDNEATSRNADLGRNRTRAELPAQPNREGPIRRTREGGSEWEPIKILLDGDENSNKTNAASNTRLRLTTQVDQAHVATGVPLDLGTNTHSLPTRERSGTTNPESTDPHRSDR